MSDGKVTGPSRLLAFVRPELDSGPILEVDGEGFAAEIDPGGWDISDHNMLMPDHAGLQVYEGWVECGPGPDPDCSLVGRWRVLSHWEMSRIRFGMPIFSDGDS